MTMTGYGFGLGELVLVLFWIFVVAAAVWLVLTFARPATGSGDAGSARRILDERLARGELDVEEYRTRRTALDERTR